MFLDKFKGIILRRRQAYRRLFSLDGENRESARVVMTDLRTFCRGTSTPAMVSQQSGMIDPLATGILIGRQEVWHRIQQNVHMSDADIYKLVDESGTE